MTAPDSSLAAQSTPKPTGSDGPSCAVAAGSALHIDHGPIRRSFTRDELLQFCKTWMRARSIDIGCSRDYYHERLGLLVDFATDLFDGPNQ